MEGRDSSEQTCEASDVFMEGWTVTLWNRHVKLRYERRFMADRQVCLGTRS